MSIPANHERCTFLYADGRRCRMLRSPRHPYLCQDHWERGQRANDAIVFASQILKPGEELTSPLIVARALTNVFRLFAAGRISSRDASTMAYINALVVPLLPQLERQQKAAARAAAKTTDVFDTIQKDSFEEDVIKNALALLRGDPEEPGDSPAPSSSSPRRSAAPIPPSVFLCGSRRCLSRRRPGFYFAATLAGASLVTARPATSPIGAAARLARSRDRSPHGRGWLSSSRGSPPAARGTRPLLRPANSHSQRIGKSGSRR